MNQIQKVKDKYGNKAEEIICGGLSLQKKGSKYRCPNTLAHKHGDRNPSMGWDSKRYQFHCFTCGMNIDLYGYYRQHLNYTHQEIIRELLGGSEHDKTEIAKKRVGFVEEIKKVKTLTKECREYINSRGITNETIEAFNLSSYEGNIAFPYVKYETIVGYKTRKPVKNPGKHKMLSVEGSKPYLFNSHTIEDAEELIICEGEFDCMVIWQCGFKNVVSVGAGANSMSVLFEQAKDFLDSFQYLIIVSDNDESGSNMDNIFTKEFGDKAKLINKQLYTMNDVNEEYFVNGEASIKAIIESGRFKIEGRRDLNEKPYTGLAKKTGNYIPTGLDTIDFSLNDLMPGCITLICGRSNSGKTTLVKQIIANAISRNNKVYVVSGEGDQETFINELYKCIIGRNESYYDLVKVNKRYHKEPKDFVLKALQKWHNGKLTLFNKGESRLKTVDSLFSMLEYEIKIKRHNLIVIDNLMSVLSVKAAGEKNEAQADFVQRCHNLAELYRTHIILVLHPNKEYRKGASLELEQISGSSDIYNKIDNAIMVIREYDKEKIEQGINGRIEIQKNRYYSDLVGCDIHFEKETGLLLELCNGECIAYKFKWEQYLDEKYRPNSVVPDNFEQVVFEKDCPF
jgi:twinkle protein